LIQSATFTSEPVLIHKDGSWDPYIPRNIKGPRDAYAANLHLIFKHVSEFHIVMMDILSEKYNIPAEELATVVRDDPRFTEMVLHPMIHTMGYFTEKEGSAATAATAVESLTASVNAIHLEVPEVSEVPEVPEVPEAPEVPKKKRVIRKKATTTAK
jgi:hypothetical protein